MPAHDLDQSLVAHGRAPGLGRLGDGIGGAEDNVLFHLGIDIFSGHLVGSKVFEDGG